MDDVISRQALLDKFEPWLKVKDYNDGELNMLKAILYEIRFMRSAQPAFDARDTQYNLPIGTDCISRQAAIDALRTCYDTETITMDNGDEYINYGDAVGEIEQLPPAEPKIIYCKDCRKHNKRVGFDENFHPVWKEDACPLVSWRGKAQGHEFDYQFCAYAERREVTE